MVVAIVIAFVSWLWFLWVQQVHVHNYSSPCLAASVFRIPASFLVIRQRRVCLAVRLVLILAQVDAILAQVGGQMRCFGSARSVAQ